MGSEISFDRALAAVADGVSIDWDAVERVSRDADDRQRVRALRLLAEIGDLHRSTGDPMGDPLAVAAAAAATRPAPPPRPASASRPPGVNDTIDVVSGPRNAPSWGRYRLVEKVGSGGFGQVYRAWDSDLDREVAIKLLHQHVSDEVAGQRVRQEGRALARISQPNVIAVHGVEVHEERAGLVMEFVRGHTLEDLVRTRGSFSAPEATLIGQDVCRALSAVHRAGYLHRDVKARNVMREQAGRIVLMDFGTGREERPDRPAGTDLTGTPIYMAPEVLDGKPASTRSDVYSVGVLLFYLVSGAHPVQARSTSELRAAHREGRRRLLSEYRSDIPAAFVRVVERALAPKPDARYPNAAALFDALNEVIDPTPPVPVPAPWTLMQRVAVASLAAFAVILAMGALTSAAFNLTLGRAEFASETFVERLQWGVKAIVPPLFILLVAWLAYAVVGAMWRVAVGFSARARALDERLRQRIARLTFEPQLLASLVLVCSALLLVGAWVWFRDLLDAMTSFVRFAPADKLDLLGPRSEARHDAYNLTLCVLLVATLAGWLAVRRASLARGLPTPRAAGVGILIVLGLELGSLGIAYRLLIHNELPAMAWNGEVCYATGERAGRVLLFCPSRDVDRSLVVPRSDPALLDLHRSENLFTRGENSR